MKSNADLNIDAVMRENARRRAVSLERQNQERAFAVAYIRTNNLTQAANEVGISPKKARELIHEPEVRDLVEEGLSKAAIAAGVSSQWVLEKLKEIVDRCMVAVPVTDKEGNETGEWKFDSSQANRALELIGKHLQLFRDKDESAAAQLGNAVIRVLAQEAQAGRHQAKPIDTSAEPAEKGPIAGAEEVQAPGSVDRAGESEIIVPPSPPPDVPTP